MNYGLAAFNLYAGNHAHVRQTEIMRHQNGQLPVAVFHALHAGKNQVIIHAGNGIGKSLGSLVVGGVFANARYLHDAIGAFGSSGVQRLVHVLAI